MTDDADRLYASHQQQNDTRVDGQPDATVTLPQRATE